MIKQPEYREQIDHWVDAHAGQMLEDLKALVRIPSVKGEAKDGMPFGEMPAKAVSAMQELMEKAGLRTTNYENYCVAGDLDAEGEKALDILTHLDVVPVSDSWTKTRPFEPLIEGDRIYGRGTSDDKGPAIAALYAVRCIRELGLGLKRGVRLICGSDEESGSDDLVYYYSKEKEALYTFSPDADYPLINVEKGRLQKSFRSEGPAAGDAAGGKTGKVRVKCLQAGDTTNIVPGLGEMTLSGVTEEMLQSAAEKLQDELPDDWARLQEAGGGISWERQQDAYAVTFSGISSHAAHPAGGISSLTMMLAYLQHLDLADAPGENMLLRLGKLWPHGDYEGKSLGIDCRDQESGPLTMSLDILHYEVSQDGSSYRVEGIFDCRAPLCCNDDNLTKKVRDTMKAAGFEMEEGTMEPGHYVSADSELVQKLLESYELYFEKKGTPLSTGGGTYVHELERGVAFGCAVPEVDNRMHGDDEFMEIPILVKSTKIIADAILRLCG